MSNTITVKQIKNFETRVLALIRRYTASIPEGEVLADNEADQIDAIYLILVELLLDFYETASPDMKVAAILMERLLTAPSLHVLGEQIVEQLEADIYDDNKMKDEDAKKVKRWRNIIMGADIQSLQHNKGN